MTVFVDTLSVVAAATVVVFAVGSLLVFLRGRFVCFRITDNYNQTARCNNLSRNTALIGPHQYCSGFFVVPMPSVLGN